MIFSWFVLVYCGTDQSLDAVFVLISSVNFEVPVLKCLCVKKASFFPCFLMMFFGSSCPASAVMRLYSDLFSEYILVMKYLDLAFQLVILYVILTIYFGIDCHITGICLKDSFGDKKIGFCRVFFMYKCLHCHFRWFFKVWTLLFCLFFSIIILIDLNL